MIIYAILTGQVLASVHPEIPFSFKSDDYFHLLLALSLCLNSVFTIWTGTETNKMPPTTEPGADG